MKLTNLTIKDLFTPEVKLTFLVGAGCSIDPPSCLPDGRTMMNAIIDYTCAESEIDKIKKLKGLRFEQLIEILSEELDPELKVIDFYGLCDKPNVQHFFLAEMMKQGQFVLTTNFDFLIEYALQQSDVSKEEIKVVITREDFEEFRNPQELYLNGLKALYKIHGSTKNAITQEDTRTYLVATIRAFGANKEGENVFQLESFKQPLFTNITKNRSLVVMGYSGSDDFDIVPTLKVLEHIQDIAWINYIHDDRGKELIYEIETVDIDNNANLEKVDQILIDIKKMNYARQVLRVDVNTTRMVKELIPFQTEISSDAFSIDAYEWLSNNINTPDTIIKLYIPFKIYLDFDLYEDGKRCIKEILRLAKESGNQYWKIVALNGIGWIYYTQGNHPKALKRYEKALQIAEQLGDLGGKATALHNIGLIYEIRGDYKKTLDVYEEALKITEQLGDPGGKVSCLLDIGGIYVKKGKYSKTLKLYEEALKIAGNIGYIEKKATCLRYIASIYFKKRDYDNSLKKIEEALKIDKQLGNLLGKAYCFKNIGLIYRAQGNYNKALKYLEEALRNQELSGYLVGQNDSLSCIAMIHYDQENYEEALKGFEESLKIAERLGDLESKSRSLNNIGETFRAQGNYPEALKRYEESLEITDQLGHLEGRSACLHNIGLIHYDQGNYSRALKRFEEALQIDEQLGDLGGRATTLRSIGGVYYNQGNYPKALKSFEESLEIYEQLKELPNIALCLWWNGMIYGKLNDTSKALQNLESALEIYEQLGLETQIQQVREAISKLKS